MEDSTQLYMETHMREFAIKLHESVNDLYDGKNYSVHLDMVAEIANRWIHLIPEPYRILVLDGCYLHDAIENCRLTYNDIREQTNTTVADIVYAVTNEKGRTRKERANDKYYQGIKDTEFATFVKLCDRIANMEYSKKSGSRMYEMYKKENSDFISKLWTDKYKDMFFHLETI